MSKEHDDLNDELVMNELRKALLEIQRIENETHKCMCVSCVASAVRNINESVELAERWGLIAYTGVRYGWEREGKKFHIFDYIEEDNEGKR